MWLTFVLAIISKLDAVPVISVLSLAFLMQNRSEVKSLSLRSKVVTDFMLYAVVPMSLWIMCSTMMFGSPIPQSAATKLYHYHHPEHWYHFALPLIQSFATAPFAILMVILWVVYSFYYIKTKNMQDAPKTLVFGLASIAYIALYCYYNPAERHFWYYAVAELLIKLQVFVFILCFVRQFKKNRLVKVLVPALSMLLVLYSMMIFILSARNHAEFLAVVEAERMAMGQWINQHSQPDDVLFTGFGHVARESGLYTIDFSGLNSPIVTEYHMDMTRLIDDLKPDWIAQHGLLDHQVQTNGPYVLSKSWYNIATTKNDYTVWRVYAHAEEDNDEIPIAVAIKEDHLVQGQKVDEKNSSFQIVGSELKFAGFDPNKEQIRFITGLLKSSEPISLTTSFYSEDNVVFQKETMVLAQKDMTHPVTGITDEWVIDLSPHHHLSSIVITTEPTQSVTLIDPIFLQ
jgi:hypothetical protein